MRKGIFPKQIFQGPEAAGFVILGATLGAVLASAWQAGLPGVWAGGVAGAVTGPAAMALPWGRMTRRLTASWTSSTI